jgi:DNA phosphorothioation-associated putative methyltransferase
MSRRSKSLGLKTAERLGLVQGAILDYGCGRGDDVRALWNEGHDVIGYDPHVRDDPPYGCLSQPPVARGAYDLVLCTYVLNVVTRDVRAGLVQDAWSYVKPGGTLIVTVRDDTELHSQSIQGWTRHDDGWITRAGTFQRFFPQGHMQAYLKNLLTRSYVREIDRNVTVVHKHMKED